MAIHSTTMGSIEIDQVPSNSKGTALAQVSSQPFRRECYLPAPTPQCHASNLCLLKNGDILCSWFGGSQEGVPDISIYISRLLSGSKQWSTAEKVSEDPTRSEQNPVLFETPAGPLWLLYTSQDRGNQETAVVKKRVSNDRGKTWGPIEVLFDDAGTFIRQPMIVLDNGSWAIPVFKCRTEPGLRWIGNDDISCVRVSTDQGRTWSETEVPNSYGCVHMGIRRLKKGSYLALYRSRWADHIYSSTSPDGVEWSTPEPTTLPNPNSGICFEVLPSGNVVVVYNHSSAAQSKERREGLYDEIASSDDVRRNQASKHAGKEAFWGAPRAPLCLAISTDEGRTWSHEVIEDGDGYCMTNNSENKLNRELSYPSMFLGEDGVIHIAFTYWRQRIKYVQLKEDFVSIGNP